MKKVYKSNHNIFIMWTVFMLGAFISANSLAAGSSCTESLSFEQFKNGNSHFSAVQQPLVLAQASGKSRPSAVGGSRPERSGGSRPEGVGGSRPDGVGGSRPEGVGGSRPERSAGSRPEGVGGSRPDGVGGSRPNWRN